MKPKRITAFLLSVAMILSLVPTFSLTALADETGTQATTTAKNITLGTSALKGGQKSNVYFGNYKQSSDGNGGYNIDPIKWRVLDTANDYDGNAVEGTTDTTTSLLLLSDQNLDVFQYHTDYEAVTWEESTMRSWLNGYESKENIGDNADKDSTAAAVNAGIDYSNDNFISKAFSSGEQKSIVKTSVKNESNGSVSGGNNTEDQVFLLSIAETKNTAYGFTADTSSTDTRVSTNTDYVTGGGEINGDMYGSGEADCWWLRSPGYYASSAAYVDYDGSVCDSGSRVSNDCDAVRPAFNLNSENVLFTSAATGSKSENVGTVSKNADFGSLTGNDGYKLTLKREYAEDEGKFSAEQKETSTQKGGTLKFEYSNAKTGDNEYISAMITNKDGKNVLYYGQLTNVTEANGTVELKIPIDIAFGEYKVKLFNEQINGDCKTDYSSAFSDIPLTVVFEGSGTEADPYLIYTISDLEYFRDKVNSGTTYEGKHIKLMDDINMGEKYGADKGNWTPIGNKNNKFSGTFDGDGHTVTELYINGDKLTEQGLFGYAENATVRNLSVTGSVTGFSNVGGIAGRVYNTTFENCSNAAAITGYFYAIGGIVGYGGKVFKRCRNTGKITADTTKGTGTERSGIGGIVGDTPTEGVVIENCYNTAEIETGEIWKQYVGGIVGALNSNATMSNCYSTGKVTVKGTNTTNVGLIVGKAFNYSKKTLSNLYYNTENVGEREWNDKDNSSTTISSKVYGKTATEFASGEVAYALQGNRDTIVWGQNIGEDKVPTLTSSDDKKVYKITFLTSEKNTERDPYAVRYANKSFDEANFPQNPDDKCEYWWSLTNDVNGTKFDKNTEITKDMTVYGVKKEITEASDKSDTITLSKNKEITTPIDLSDYVKNKSGNEKNFAFELVEGQTLPDGLEFEKDENHIGKITGTPTKVETYTVKFNVTNNSGISLMSLDTVNDVDVLTLTFDVDLEGEGTETKPYLINDLNDLEYFRDKVNGGKNYNGEYVKLMDNIDMADKYSATTKESWTPIGKDSAGKIFVGTFDGNGKEIQNLYINTENNNYIGLFGIIGAGAEIKKLGVTGSVRGNKWVAAIIGYNRGGSVINCYNKATVNGSDISIGGIVGHLTNGYIQHCYNIGKITGADNVGGVVGTADKTTDFIVINSYYLTGTATIAIGNYGYDSSAEAKTETEFNSGEVAWLLQNGQTDKTVQVWGQKLTETKDKYPVLTNETDKKVYKVAQMANTPTSAVYNEYSAVYGNDSQEVTLNPYKGEREKKFYGWVATKGERTPLITAYTVNKADTEVYSVWNELTFEISGEKQTYKTGTPRTITLVPKINGAENENVKASAFDVKYYEVNENTGKLRSTDAVNAISAGKYLYVISFANNDEGENARSYCNFNHTYKVETSTDLPLITDNDNIGYMLITSGAETAQKPMYFEKQVVNAKMTDTVSNALTNPNTSTVTYESSDTSVAVVDENTGAVTIKGAGSTVIVATGVVENTSDVYASYTLNVTKEVITIVPNPVSITYGDDFTDAGYTIYKNDATANDITLDTPPVCTTEYTSGDGVGKYDINASGASSRLYDIEYRSAKLTVGAKPLTKDKFDVTVSGKTYDTTTTAAAITAKVADAELISGDIVTVLVNGEFDSADAGERTVRYTITGLSGKDGNNYVLSGDMTDSKSATISQAKVTVSVPSVTTYVYDTLEKSVNVLAYANGIYFDKYKVTYNGDTDLPTDEGTYTVGITLTDNNYVLDGTISATLKIEKAQQNFFSIEGISDTVLYGDELTLQTVGAIQGGTVTYEIVSGGEFVEQNGNKIKAKGTGTVTVKATSAKANYIDKTAERTFVINPRPIGINASATDKVYDGTKNINVTLAPTGVLDGDTVTVSYTTATVATADVETGKTVFVNGIAIDNSNYKLSSTTAQTSVNITKKTINDITLTAQDKIYDTTDDVTAYTAVIADTELASGDKGCVSVSGTARFNSANVKDATTVTLSDLVLSGTKSGNYQLGKTQLTASASIKPATVSFTFGTLSYVYDGKAKQVPITATVDGKTFSGYTVTYGGSENQSKVGDYDIAIELKDKDNYTSDYTATKQLKIMTADQSEITITGLLGTIDYGRQFTLTAVGGSVGDNIKTEWSSSDTSMATVEQSGLVKIVGTNKAVTITVTKTDENGNLNPQTASVTFTPTKKAVTIKISKLNQVYDGDVKSVEVTTVADTKTILYTDEGGNKVTAPTNAGTYYVTVTANGNYEGEQSAVLTIKKAKRNTDDISLEIPENIVYGTSYDVNINGYDGNDGVITYTGSGIYNGQTAKPTNAGSYMATLTIENDNYETAVVTKSFTIQKAVLYVRPDDATRKYGEQNPAFTLSYYSDENCTNAVENADITIAPSISTEATVNSESSAYPIKASGGYAENYSFEYVDGTLTVTQSTGGNFYIMNGNPTPYVGTKFTLVAYYNNEQPAVEWSSNNTDVATVDANGEVVIVGEGDATITAKMTDNRFDNTLTATFALKAAKLNQTQNNIVFESPIVEKYANDDTFTITPTNVSDNAIVTYKSSNPDIASVDENSGEVTINKVGTTVITATAEKTSAQYNYTDVYASYTLVVNKIPTTITAEDKNITYGDTVEGSVVYADGLSADDFGGELAFRTKYTAGKDVGEYDIEPMGLTSDIYDITFETGTITVNEKILTADDFTVVAKDKTYDMTADVTISASVNENALVGADKLTVVIDGSFKDENAGDDKTVTYSIVALSGRGFENYTLKNTDNLTTTANIKKAEVTFFVSAETVKNYDGEAHKVEISAMANSNVFGSENYTVYYQKEGEDKTTEPTNVGEYTVSIKLADGDNYEVKPFEAKLIIERDADTTLNIMGSNKNVTVGDMITLYAQYANTIADVEWSSSDDTIATIDENGEVRILKSGNVTITATMKDENYGELSAEFEFIVSKKHITLSASAAELVKTYNGEVQYVKFTSNIDLDDVTINTSYAMTTDADKTEPKDVGVYTVSYDIDDERYEGYGVLQLTINKATVIISADNAQKEYGENAEFALVVSDNVTGVDADFVSEFANITSDGAVKTANVGEYDINVELTTTSDDNCNYVVNADANGKLSVTKARLTVEIEDISREYMAENPTQLTYTITGFKNDDTDAVLTGTIAPVYSDTIAETVGTQKDVVTAISTFEAQNYDVEIAYADGNGADLTITKVKVAVTDGTAKKTYITIKLDKPIEGLDADNFIVENGDKIIKLTSVSASDDNMTYTLKGDFSASGKYTVTVNLISDTHGIVSEPVSVKISTTTGGGGGGGGSAATTEYTVKFDTNGADDIAGVTVEKNKTVTKPNDPTKDGFEFGGWYIDSDFTTEYDFTAKVTKNITLYAKWIEKEIENPNENKDDNNNSSTSEYTNPFDDVKKNDWYFDSVKYANQNGLMSGTTATTFAPNNNLTRGMLVTVLYRAEGEPAVNKSIPFADVKADMYYANAVIWAAQNGIVKGMSETEFAPDECITREQIATIIYRYAQYKGIAPTGAWAIKLNYADVADISDYAVDGVMYCTMKNIMQGKENNMFAPKDNATRAEIAAILNRFIESNK